ncbi:MULTISPECIES: flagellar assembly peptidoglycan hydrolase FlgJ [Mangrovibacter]|uniref:Peptidoglycan hydrolase FlgJ n=1 Tax=Mangrovibacter plantisponsor TaxID=451513 RepID=A0A317Q3D9_9ENTR|nr:MULTISPECIES: flagellar assembly peptidoglycan hydrolase FlgJ [Mangrovibacter]KEA52667.1 flagellar rod assembly protein FlgJ [Mangrovibacter sp. MFB070]PWW09987.1 flagellar protein FlgJ [Mangrovibacter plantisponsor]
MINDTQSMAGAAWDAQSLNELKRAAANDPQAHLKAVAKKVEGMFVQMVLKSMRQALPKDDLLDNDQTRLYTSMYDQQIADDLSAKGLGLADMMVKQMTNGTQSPSEKAGTVPMKLDMNTVMQYQTQEFTQLVRKAIPKAPPSSGAIVSFADKDLDGDSKNFLAQLSLPAKLASEQSGIPHHLILAQAALESGWGQRQIRTASGAPSFNIFGVKATGNWKGPTTEITTTEFENGQAKKVKAAFRVYSSYLEALSDYVGLLSKNPRYAAVTTAATAEQGAQALQRAGYATDPGYASKLTSLIQQLKSMSDKVSKAYNNDLSNLF